MRLRLSSASGVLVYRQIMDQIGYLIAARRLRAGDRLPSVRDLARSLPANQNTVLKAYELLERDGLILRRHGDGTLAAGRSSPLNLAARRQKVAAALAHAAMLAQHFELGPDAVHALLDQELRRLAGDRGRHHE